MREKSFVKNALKNHIDVRSVDCLLKQYIIKGISIYVMIAMFPAINANVVENPLNIMGFTLCQGYRDFFVVIALTKNQNVVDARDQSIPVVF